MTTKKRIKTLPLVVVAGFFGLASACNESITKVDVSDTSAAPTIKQSLPVGTSVEIIDRWQVEDFDKDIVQFATVFWEAEDSVSLRKLIRETNLVRDKRILEIGTGTGLISLCCLQAGAHAVVATDINPQAVANAQYNLFQLDIPSTTEKFDVRLVDADNSGAFAVIASNEQFDVIISNPPWEDGEVQKVADYAFIDTQFELLESILSGLDQHLTANGEAYLAYGCVAAIREIYRRAERHGLQVVKLDERELDSLENLFLPGMLLKITRP
jgi:release factor glutamine methyltransferase|tara:strand:- start:35 stop:844 length:810 start_codon:yes stop_codon:yes gene_type:complete